MSAEDRDLATSVTAAHFLTLDFTSLTSGPTLWSRGLTLEDRTNCEHVKVFSLIELEQGIDYRTPHGNTLVRVSRTEALLAGKISLPVDLVDPAVSPRTSADFTHDAPGGDRSSVIGSALQHVRSLGAEPTVETLGTLLQTLRSLPPADDGWLESFLEARWGLNSCMRHSWKTFVMPARDIIGLSCVLAARRHAGAARRAVLLSADRGWHRRCALERR